MSLRTIRRAAAVVVVLGLAACGSDQAGTAVKAGDGNAPSLSIPLDPSVPPSSPGHPADPPSEASGTVESPEPTALSEPTAPSQPTVASPTDGSGPVKPTDGSGPVKSSAPAVTSASTDPGGTAESSTDSSGETVPKDMCDLMPAELAKGLEKSDGDPQLRCSYTGSVNKKFVGVSVYQSPFDIDEDDPSGNDSGRDVKPLTIDGRQAFSWVGDLTDAATIAFNVGEGAVYVSYGDEGKSDAENLKIATGMAEKVSAALKSGTKVEGGVEAPPSTTAAKIPKGKRGWPGVVCDLMPAELMAEMEASRGYESDRCRLQSETETGFTNIELRKGIPVDPEDPSGGLDVEVQEESFDGRTAYSWVDGNKVPNGNVVFSTGDRSSAVIRYAISDVETEVDPEAVRTAALELAEQVAPKLPQP